MSRHTPSGPGRALLLAALTAALAQCQQAPAKEAGITLEVECLGMARDVPLAGYYRIATRFGGRCNLLVSDTVYEQELTLIDGALGNLGQPNTAALQLLYGGRTWTARSGTLRLDSVEDTSKVSGRYQMEATSDRGEAATISGPLDWCDYARRTDCPYVASGTSGGLTKHASFTDPDDFRAAWESTYTTDCRVLIDRASGGAQVDLQFGVFNGFTIPQFADQCDRPDAPPNPSFQFRTGGVTGPGTYGPFQSYEAGGVRLPDFELAIPMVFYGWTNACLTQYSRRFYVRPKPPLDVNSALTTCTYTITEGNGTSPGRFELACTGAEHSEDASAYLVEGDFTLAADCDVRYR